MNGITVLGYAFGPKVFCEQFRQKLLQLKGTYIIFQYFKCQPKIPTCLLVNHKVEIVVTRRTVLTPVTIQKDYKDFRTGQTNQESLGGVVRAIRPQLQLKRLLESRNSASQMQRKN